MNKFTALCILAVANAAGSNFNYDFMGSNWGNVNQLCDTGRRQSPIDLPKNDDKEKVNTHADLLIEGHNYTNYASQKVLYSQTGNKDVKVNAGQGKYQLTSYDGVTYPFNLAQFHIHSPSEHTVDGKFYDVEMHFVHLFDHDNTQYPVTADHYSGNADFAVIGVFFDREAGGNETNEFLKQMDITNPTTNLNSSGYKSINALDVAEFLGSQNFETFYHYDGSFTTPPCTEGVKWVVLNEVQPISEAQYQAINSIWAGDSSFANNSGYGNNRITQPVYERTVYYSGASALLSSLMVSAVAIMNLF